MAYRAIIKGVVQGVGFRPFVYRVAKEKGVRGFVRNIGNSVEIFIDEEREKARLLLDTIKNEHPPLAEIFSIDVRPSKSKNYDDFLILESKGQGEGGSDIPPDVCICDKCVEEMFEKGNRRYLYPFTVCTDCGPRFTIIEALPYDRDKTTMKEFQMCEKCEKEYLDPMDRRFHAEPTCCEVCGPKYTLYRDGSEIRTSNPIREAARALDQGFIVAIKGVGGTHLATKTTEDDPILRIREILGRREKPFAIMARDINAAKAIAYVGEAEEKLLQSFRRPIVVLKKKDMLSEYVAPGLHNIGIMLPYSGIHYLLFHYSEEPAFVMTSANLPGEPMAIEKEEILALRADYSLIHNRRIKNRCDDSVMRIVDGRPAFLRRSRGFVPQHIEIFGVNGDSNILAVGPELEVTSCILKGNSAFLSQYIGNTTRLSTLDYLEQAIYNLLELTKVERIDAVAVDMHPSFNTSRLGRELADKFNAELVKCQHHHAHITSLMAEAGVDRIVGIAVDGAGYGVDGTVWGGEILVVDSRGFKRAGSLQPQIMPGGDLATRFPARMVAGILSREYSPEELDDILRKHVEKGFRSREEIRIVLKQIQRGFNTPETTSLGRVLDAISALLGACYERTYEGEPAMKLEALADGGRDDLDIPVKIKQKDRYLLNTTDIVDAVLNLKESNPTEDVAASAQRALSDGLAEMAVKIAKREKIDIIGISGGVSYNHAIVANLRRKVEGEGLKFITHEKVPCGDGGISLGQTWIAAQKLRLIA
jgi:hydrogenase maturation protein HypF